MEDCGREISKMTFSLSSISNCIWRWVTDQCVDYLRGICRDGTVFKDELFSRENEMTSTSCSLQSFLTILLYKSIAFYFFLIHNLITILLIAIIQILCSNLNICLFSIPLLEYLYPKSTWVQPYRSTVSTFLSPTIDMSWQMTNAGNLVV